MIHEDDFAAVLMDALHEPGDSPLEELDVTSVCSFEEAGLLTHDKGVVVSLGDGSQFQVRIAQSRAAV